MRAVEQDVLGCDFGGTSWTTRIQADKIPAALGLDASSHLLEIGAGTGWPGLYLSKLTGCDITLLDVPLNSLRHAQQRALEEKLGKRCQSVAASGAALPFRDASFESISHSDVLCCLHEKMPMLSECRRVARTGARMLFYVIAPAKDLCGSDLDEACRVGPPFVGLADNYTNLLTESGWQLLEKTDLTTEYLAALRRLVQRLENGSNALLGLLGNQQFEEQLEHRRQQISAIERGLLERELYLAEAA